jgi:predicted amidophosphoribosyltransferase
VCADCEAVNSDIENGDDTKARKMLCEACANDVDVIGPVTTETICPVCGQPMVAG